MKILILYFSGTGNTYFIADKIRNELSKKNYDVNLSSVEKFQPVDIEKFDTLILGYPIYALDMPLFLQEYINKLTIPRTKTVILFSTMGFYGANASRKIGLRLVKAGMIPLHFEEIKMPGSDALMFMKKESEHVLKIKSTNFDESVNINRAVNNIVSVIDNLFIHNEVKERIKLPHIKLGGLIVDGLMNIIYKFVEKKLKQKFWVNNKCIKCHLCENICPSHNIVVKDEKVVFLDKCFLCMRCINQCPTEAIQIGKKTNEKFRWKGPSGNYKPKDYL